MNLSPFFLTFPGMYLVQSVFHSLIAAIVVESAISAWEITDPILRQRFRFAVILFPIFSYPLYQAVNPERGSMLFRLEAFLDTNRWLYLELWGGIPFYYLFLAALAGTAAVFFFQELMPIVRHSFRSQQTETSSRQVEPGAVLSEAMAALPGEKPPFFCVEDDEILLYSSTGNNGAIFVSTGLIDTLDRDQLVAALAHELAHIRRSKRPSLLIIFMLRMLMFYNPVVLVEFRKIVHGEEKICDDMAVSFTGKPRVLAETLKQLFHRTEEMKPFHTEKLVNLRSAVEEYSHNMHIEGRIERLERGEAQQTASPRIKYGITLAVMVMITYFVV
ncbi:MAG: M48 family metalloprotease [bacterium]|nr:M48 family metalloprotease [bacterium]